MMHPGWNISMGNVFGMSTSGIPISVARHDANQRVDGFRSHLRLPEAPNPNPKPLRRVGMWKCTGLELSLILLPKSAKSLNPTDKTQSRKALQLHLGWVFGRLTVGYLDGRISRGQLNYPPLGV